MKQAVINRAAERPDNRISGSLLAVYIYAGFKLSLSHVRHLFFVSSIAVGLLCFNPCPLIPTSHCTHPASNFGPPAFELRFFTPSHSFRKFILPV